MVFISYSSKDTDAANAVRMMLQNNGIDCWMAPESIAMGEDYSNAIPKAIEVCDLFLLILSANSQGSKWVPKELDSAISQLLHQTSQRHDRLHTSIQDCIVHGCSPASRPCSTTSPPPCLTVRRHGRSRTSIQDGFAHRHPPVSPPCGTIVLPPHRT